jgi:predicted transcriptional regulator with HTH domain
MFKVDGMQEAEKSEITSDIKIPLAMRSLRRSNVRKKIAEYLFEISPSYSYTSEIAYNINTTPSNVLGALRGMESRYKEDESLIGLDIVEIKKSGKDIKLYGITSFGKEIIENLKNKR